MGRLLHHVDYDDSGQYADYDRAIQLDGKGRIWIETINQRYGSSRTVNTYSYTGSSPSDDALGQVNGTQTVVIVAGQSGETKSSVNYGYAFFDGPQQQSITRTENDAQSTTTYSFSGTGTLTGVSIGGQGTRPVSIVNDILGQVIHRTEGAWTPQGQQPVAALDETWYRFDGRLIGSRNTSTTDTASWDETVQRRRALSISTTRIGSADDWDPSYEAFNSYAQGSAAGSYTVRAGDTLAGIAANLWGDAGLWYKIAQANGLAGADTSLTAGTILQLPANVVRTTNNATTFRPYDPTDAYGDTSPTTPTPKARGNKCGVFRQILTTVVVTAVAIVAAPLGPVGQRVAMNIAEQGMNNLTGVQKGFNWKSLALTAAAAAISVQVDKLAASAADSSNGLISGIGHILSDGGAASAAARAAISNAATQGVAIATHMQTGFDFGAVAKAGAIAFATTTATDAIARMQQRAASAMPAASGATGFGDAPNRSIITGPDSLTPTRTVASMGGVGSDGYYGNEVVVLAPASFAEIEGPSPKNANASLRWDGADLVITGPRTPRYHPTPIPYSDLLPGLATLIGVEFTRPNLGYATPYGSFPTREAARRAGGQFISSGPTLAEQRQARDRSIDRSILTTNAPYSLGDITYIRARSYDVSPDQALTAKNLTDNVGDLVMAAGAVRSGAGANYRISGTAPGVSLSVGRASSYNVAGERTAVGAAADLPSGSFSISDWSGYPAGVPRPQGPFRIVESAEYNAARDAANNANRVIRREQGLVGQPVDVHEIQPVKFGGSPTDPANKVVLPRDVHRQQVTPWWNQLQRDMGH